MNTMDMGGFIVWSGDQIKSVTLANGNIEIKFKDESVIMAYARCGFAAPKSEPLNKIEIVNLTGQGEVCEIVPQRQ